MDKGKKKNIIRFACLLSLFLIIACSSLNVLGNPEAVTITQSNKIKESTNTFQVLTNTVTTASCMIEDIEYCQFIKVIEPYIVHNDINGLLKYIHRNDCKTENLNYCTDVNSCILSGAVQAEGQCLTETEFIEFWKNNAISPIAIRGVVYPYIPNMGFESTTSLNGPAILIKSDHPEWDLILFCNKINDEWSISFVLLQLRTAAKYQTPDEIIIPWE